MELDDDFREALGYGQAVAPGELAWFRVMLADTNPVTRAEAEARRLAASHATQAVIRVAKERADDERLGPWEKRSIMTVASKRKELMQTEAFVARVKRHGLMATARMKCHGREIPEDPALLHEGLSFGARMARIDLCVHLFVTKGWSIERIRELFGYGFLAADIQLWLEGRNFVVPTAG